MNRLEQFYLDHRTFLTAMAYKLTGSWAEAEDIVQETFLTLFEKDTALERVDHPAAYFRRAVVNRSLNALQSPRMSRETYTGTWLPEPVFEPSSPSKEEDPLLREEQISYAFMVMLEKLSPEERTVFVLRESFAMDYSEIAEILGKNEVACRKLLSRARQKVGASGEVKSSKVPAVSDWVQAFMKASRNGNFSSLLGMIREDAVMWSDGGGKVRSAIFPILSRERIIAFWNGISRKGSLQGEWIPMLMNGEPGILQYRDGVPVKAVMAECRNNGEISKLYVITNPDKLANAPAFSSVK